MEKEASARTKFQLFLAVFLDLFGFGIIIPILPYLFIELGKGPFFEAYSEFLYGLLIATYSFMQFLMAPIWGRISDKVGRRPVILTGVFGSSIGFAIFGFAESILVLFIARIIAGFFTAATLTTANAYIADITPPKKRGAAFGLLTSAFGLGFALGPAVGGLLTDMTIFGLSGHIVPSLFASCLSLVNFVGAYFFVKESMTQEQKNKIESRKLFSIVDIGKLRQYAGTLTFVGLFALVTLGFSNWITSFSINAPKIDPSIHEKQLGLVFTFTGIVLFLSQPLIVKPVINKYGEKVLIYIGAFFGILGFFTLPLATNFQQMLVSTIPLILGISFLNPSINSVISRTVPGHKQGEVMGISQGLASLMRVFGPLFAGYLLTLNMFFPYYIGGSIFIIIFGLLIYKISFPWELEKTDTLSFISTE